MDGRMFEYDAERNLVAFRTGESSDVLLFLGGLNDGFMCRKYVALIQQASAPHWSVVQVQLGSFFRGWGTRSLHQDVEDIDLLLQYMCDHGMAPRRLVIMGSSTGCQQAVLFLKEGRQRQLVSGLVLQAPVSDREAPWTDAHAELLEQATRMLQQGKGDELMPVAAASAPISAYRYHALAARLGDDDMFSSDFTPEEYQARLGHVQLPVLMCFSTDDQYVPKSIDVPKLFANMRKVMLQAEAVFLVGEDHSVTKAPQTVLVPAVLRFLKNLQAPASAPVATDRS